MRGIATNDLGVGKDGQPTDGYMQGMALIGKQTIFAEGCRGHLTKDLFETFSLREGKDPQTFAIGIKELWGYRSSTINTRHCLALCRLAAAI